MQMSSHMHSFHLIEFIIGFHGEQVQSLSFVHTRNVLYDYFKKMLVTNFHEILIFLLGANDYDQNRRSIKGVHEQR